MDGWVGHVVYEVRTRSIAKGGGWGECGSVALLPPTPLSSIYIHVIVFESFKRQLLTS